MAITITRTHDSAEDLRRAARFTRNVAQSRRYQTGRWQNVTDRLALCDAASEGQPRSDPRDRCARVSAARTLIVATTPGS